jgi:uncharacterized protein YlxW (UPF0749 family)
MPEHLDRTRTPLLTLITLQSLDEDYEAAGRRRRADGSGGAAAPGGGPAGGRTSLRGGAVALMLFGLLVSVAAVQTSREAGVDDASRNSLISRIEQRRHAVADTEDQLAALRASNTKDDSTLTALGNQLTAAQSRAAAYGALTGTAAVVGPAVRVSLDSSPYADENSQVRDSDIALLVNALWGAGAEAISVNGQRVTARTGIRTSGDAIEVNGIGVAPPYVILAIGNTDDLSADFLTSTGGQDFVALADQYAFSYDLHDVGQARMASAPSNVLRLRSARPIPDEGAAGPDRRKVGTR